MLIKSNKTEKNNETYLSSEMNNFKINKAIDLNISINAEENISEYTFCWDENETLFFTGL